MPSQLARRNHREVTRTEGTRTRGRRVHRGGGKSFASYLLTEYLPGRVAAGRAPTTIQTYTDDIHNHILPHLGELVIGAISTDALQRTTKARFSLGDRQERSCSASESCRAAA
jgi:hypothetical protein